MMIARNRGLAIHHVAVQAISGRLVGVGRSRSRRHACRSTAAHEIASRLEEAVREELGPDVEVETHIEPLPADVLAGRDASAARIAEVQRSACGARRRNRRSRRGARRARARDRRRRDRQFPLPASIRRSRSAPCTTWWTRSSAGCAGASRPSSASSATPSRGGRSIHPERRCAFNRRTKLLHQAIMRTEEPRPVRLAGLPPARLADRDRRARRVARSDRDDGPRQAQAQAQQRPARRRRSCSTARS